MAARVRVVQGAMVLASAVFGMLLVMYVWNLTPGSVRPVQWVPNAVAAAAAAAATGLAGAVTEPAGDAPVLWEALDWSAREARALATPQCQHKRLLLKELEGRTLTNATEAATPEAAVLATHWIVLTSINPPTLAVAKLAAQTGWRVVVVGDCKTPATWAHPNCVFLSLDAQRALGYRILAHLPERSYARKNIGYLYAVAHGAQVIYETDDDNLLTDPRLTLLAGSARTQRLVRTPSVDRHSVYNVYAHFGQATVWPRGYPLDAIADGPGADPATAVLGPGADAVVGIEQGLADGDPDVDAIFRLTRKNREGPIDIAFARDASPLVLPPFTFSPFNSQNTVFHAPALWATLIPTTTTFRVCDIWRGYWAQRLLWEAGATLLFREPNVRQDRNVHDYHKDFLDELDLYKDAGRLVRFLRDWRAPPEAEAADHLFARVDALTIAMAREGFWAEGDVHLVRAWLQDLLDVCYVPPRPGAAAQAPIPAFAAPMAGPSHNATSTAAVTTVLGCGNKCAMTPTVPKYLWEDVVFYTITFPGRHRMMRVVKHTWGRHLVRPLVVFTSGHDDPYVPTTFVPDPHPSWTERDRRQAVYVNEVVPLLLDLQPPAQFFINVDDDTLPVLPNIHLWLADYKARSNGSYPYYVLHTVPMDINPEKSASNYEEQADAARALTGQRGNDFPVGHIYGFSRELLEELLPIYRTCPVLRPGDVNFGGLVACSRVNMTRDQVVDRKHRRTVSPGFVRKLRMPMGDFDATLPIDHPNASFYFHGMRPEGPALAAYQQIYGRHYGIEVDPVAQRIVDGWDG